MVAAGDICFWLAGSALALLFGPTPASVGDECRLVSAANVLGRLDGDPRVLSSVNGGDRILVQAA